MFNRLFQILGSSQHRIHEFEHDSLQMGWRNRIRFNSDDMCHSGREGQPIHHLIFAQNQFSILISMQVEHNRLIHDQLSYFQQYFNTQIRYPFVFTKDLELSCNPIVFTTDPDHMTEL